MEKNTSQLILQDQRNADNKPDKEILLMSDPYPS